ncbi:hypothetical protein [Nocardioides halotolerans]|uniref:hypothetical protein n=1 Tax=Nocardioides halotolerans TaxID=433660 RepID=UPI00041B4501|nr:hypothetical protein [Nocardioides halotolerans]
MPASSGWVDLYWLPLGAGGVVVPRCGWVFERLSALREGRRPQPLFHSALEVCRSGSRHVIEMAPVWSDASPDRGVVVEGPVGLRLLGRLRAFRYEVRQWEDGDIPDRAWVADGPVRVSEDPVVADRVLDVVATVPALTWGRDELHAGDMWNSNSLVAWLLASSDVDLSEVAPPRGGRAPGWAAGLALARDRARSVGSP